jgi:hypothetical protein
VNGTRQRPQIINTNTIYCEISPDFLVFLPPPQNKENRQMNLPPSERAAMVKDLESLCKEYKNKAATYLSNWGLSEKQKHLESMAANYSALASALKEGLNFKAVA